MSKHLDFSKLRSELRREPITIDIFGQVEELPPTVPAMVVLTMHDLIEQGPDAVVNERDVMTMAKALFGEERLMRWASKGLTVEELGALLSWALEAYGLKDDDQGNGQAPRKGANRPKRST